MSQPSAPTIQVVIADADIDMMLRTRSLLAQDPTIQIIGTGTDRSDLLRLLDTEPNIFLLSTNIDPNGTSTLVKQVLEMTPRTQVLLVTEDVNSVDTRRAMMAGARGILHQPLSSNELLSTIHELIESQTTRRQRVDEITRQRQARAARGRVITVFSPKGGVGCSLLAANLAAALQQTTHKRVALVDYSIQFGTLGSLLNVQSIHNLAELVPHYAAIDGIILSDVMIQHSSGIHVLLPPETLEQVEQVTTESLVGILEGIRTHFDYVVVDTWHAMEDATIAIMEFSDELLLLTTPEVPALSTARRFLDMLKQYPLLRDKPKLVVNRHPSKGGVELAEIERSLGMEAIASVPSDGLMITAAVNEGLLLSQKNATSVTVRNLTKLAELLVVPTDRPTAAAAVPGSNRRFSLNWRRNTTG